MHILYIVTHTNEYLSLWACTWVCCRIACAWACWGVTTGPFWESLRYWNWWVWHRGVSPPSGNEVLSHSPPLWSCQYSPLLCVHSMSERVCVCALRSYWEHQHSPWWSRNPISPRKTCTSWRTLKMEEEVKSEVLAIVRVCVFVCVCENQRQRERERLYTVHVALCLIYW